MSEKKCTYYHLKNYRYFRTFLIAGIVYLSCIIGISGQTLSSDKLVATEANLFFNNIPNEELETLQEIHDTLPEGYKIIDHFTDPSIYEISFTGRILRRHYSAFENNVEYPSASINFKLINPVVKSGYYMVNFLPGSFAINKSNDPTNSEVSDSLLLSPMKQVFQKKYPLASRGDSLRILEIGNSYSQNATSYIPQIISVMGENASKVNLTLAYASGASFKDWFDICNDTYSGDYYIYGKIVNGSREPIKRFTGSNGLPFRNLLKDSVWDIIVLHQYSAYAPYEDDWGSQDKKGYLKDLIDIIKETQPNASIGLQLVHSYASQCKLNSEKWSSTERWSEIAYSCYNAMRTYPFDVLIPYGTAVQNLRSVLHQNSYDLTSDYTHLSHGPAQLVASLCYYETLFAPYFGNSILSGRFNDELLINTWKEIPVEQTNFTANGEELNTENVELAKKSAFLASRNMYNVLNPNTLDLYDNPLQVYFNGDAFRYIYKIDSSSIVLPIYGEYPPFTVRGINGILIGKRMNHDDFFHLPTGIYLVNNRKVYKP